MEPTAMLTIKLVMVSDETFSLYFAVSGTKFFADCSSYTHKNFNKRNSDLECNCKQLHIIMVGLEKGGILF